jgi:hypothetical protein
MSSILDTAEYRKLALIAAGVPLDQIPPIIDTATWRRMLIAALVKNAANQVISGSVDYFSQLPTTIGSPAIGATWLVRNSSGIFYINYRSAGVYMKVTDTGSASDWVYTPLSALGTLPDVTLTNPQIGQTIAWNGSNWVNTTNGTIFPTDATRTTPTASTTFNYLSIASFNLSLDSTVVSAAGNIAYYYRDFGFGGSSSQQFYPNDTQYGGGCSFNFNKNIFLTFTANRGTLSNLGFVRTGVTFGTTFGYFASGPSNNVWNTTPPENLPTQGFALDVVGDGSLRIAHNSGSNTSFVQTAPNIVTVDETSRWTLFYSPSKGVSVYRTDANILILNKPDAIFSGTQTAAIRSGIYFGSNGNGRRAIIPNIFQVRTSI